MRTSLLTRSLIATASMAVAAVALSAVPASAATPSGITRDQVFTAAAGVRATPTPTSSGLFLSLYDPATNRALRAMANRACVIDPDGPELSFGTIAAATVSGGSAEGLVVSAFLINTDSATTGTLDGRICSFGVLAAADSRGVLSGTATLTGLPPAALSGDVFVTSPINASIATLSGSGSDPFSALPTFSASGASTVTVDTKVADKKSTKQKKSAKAKYNKSLKSAKKTYTKALDKAGSNKAKKSKAKKAYSAAKSSAKAKYKYAVANYKLVKKSTSAPFSVSAKVTLPAAP